MGGPDDGGAGTEVCEYETPLLLLLPESQIDNLDDSESTARRIIEMILCLEVEVELEGRHLRG